MNDMSQLERSSLSTLRIIVDLMAADIVALRSEVKRLKAERTPPPQTTPDEGSVPNEGTSEPRNGAVSGCETVQERQVFSQENLTQNSSRTEPVAWAVRGREYETGCEFEFVALHKEYAEAAADGTEVIPLYTHPPQGRVVRLPADLLIGHRLIKAALDEAGVRWVEVAE